MEKQKGRKQGQPCEHISLDTFLGIMSIDNKTSFSQSMSIRNETNVSQWWCCLSFFCLVSWDDFVKIWFYHLKLWCISN